MVPDVLLEDRRLLTSLGVVVWALVLLEPRLSALRGLAIGRDSSGIYRSTCFVCRDECLDMPDELSWLPLDSIDVLRPKAFAPGGNMSAGWGPTAIGDWDERMGTRSLSI